MNTKEFIQYASEKPELCNKIASCTVPEEVYTLAQKEGVTDDFNEFAAIMKATRREIEALTDDDLEQVDAAGTFTAVTDSIIYTLVSGICYAAGLA